jgi:hypothetical protein
VDEVVVQSADLAAALTRGIAAWVEHRLDGTL